MLNFYTKDLLPRQLDVQALRLLGIGNVLQLVAQLGELLDGGIERLLRLVRGKHGLIEALRLLVPEAVQHRRVDEAIGVGGDVLEIQHDVLVVETLLANVLESSSDLLEELSLVLAARCLKTRLELSSTLSRALGALGVVLGLKLAKLLSGDHF